MRTIVRTLGVTLTLLAACAPEPTHDQHPRDELILREGPPTSTLRWRENGLRDDGAMGPELALSSALVASTRTHTIGQAEGDSQLVFGRIESAAFVSDERLVLLDGQTLKISLLSIDGRVLDVVGGPGGGPGEYQYPTNASVSDGDVAVFDGRGIATLYRVGGDSLGYLSSHSFGFPIDYGCLIREGFLVQGPRPDSGALLHLFDREGALVRSFGEIYNTDNQQLLAHASNSLIACHEASRTVYVAPVLLHEVRAYDLDGRMRWWSALEDLRRVEIQVLADGNTMVRMPRGGYHGAIELHADQTTGEIVLQIAHATPESRERRELAAIHTFALAADGRKVDYLGDDLPRVYGLRGSTLLFAQEDPFPQLVIHRVPQ